MKITAAVVEETGGPFVIQELELGALAPDEVLVEVAAAGICHTDLIVRDQWLPTPLPAVLGHEGAGVVSAVGSAVTNVAPGDRVGMSFNSCGALRDVPRGPERLLPRFLRAQLRGCAAGRQQRACPATQAPCTATSSGSRASPRMPSRPRATS